MSNRKLLETLADIAYVAGQQKLYSGDSRSDTSEFIDWAHEFENNNLTTDWDEIDYILSVEKFVKQKISNYRNIYSRRIYSRYQ